MRTSRVILRWLAWPVIVLLLMSSGALAQDSEQPGQPSKFKKEELAQMLAPIALYPDSLIADILMASTYPLEVVDAERWLRDNKNLKGDALDTALQDKTWDASIKVLCHFPEVLFAMSDKLDQTRKLGDAFLSQQGDVMAMVQELRHKAMEQGNLKSTKEQSVVSDQEEIKIEPADPKVYYVPVYDPYYVYGPWWYPAYPPYYWYWPPGVAITGGYISFGPGFFVGIDFSWFWFDWHRHVIHIDHSRPRPFERFEREQRGFDRPFWQHDPFHRRGVAYRDRVTSEHYGRTPLRVQPPTLELRGYPERRSGGITVAPSPAPRKRTEAAPTPRAKMAPSGTPETRERNTPFSGIGNGRFERRASERGNLSRQSEERLRRTERPSTRQGDKTGGKDGGSKDGRKTKERRQ